MKYTQQQDTAQPLDPKSPHLLLFKKIRDIPLSVLRTVLKASVAVTITLILVLVNKTSDIIGPASTLATLATLLYFPVRPVGVQIKIILQGTLSAVIGSAWCYLGNYLANLARNPAIESPVQPASSAVSAIFCVMLMFVLGYIRAKYPQFDFATVFASMIASFALTQNASAPGFQPQLTLTFLKPILFASAVSLVVNVVIWPEDSVSKYLDALTEALDTYNTFFEENTTAFLHNCANQPTLAFRNNLSLSTLRTQLQLVFIKLVDAQHEIDYAILYHQFSHKDVLKMTRLVKSMYAPLHGIGLSIMCNRIENNVDTEKVMTNIVTHCMEEGGEMEALTVELIGTCKLILEECNSRISLYFKETPRSLWSTFLWPFPRFWKSSPRSTAVPLSLDKLSNVISRYKEHIKMKLSSDYHVEGVLLQPHTVYKQQKLLHLFQNNLIGYADTLLSLTNFVDQLNYARRKRLSLPVMPLRNWLKPSASDTATVIGRQLVTVTTTESSRSDNSTYRGESELDLNSFKGLKEDREGATNDIEAETTCDMNRKIRPCPRDPDVDAPSTANEQFFNILSRIFNWFYSMETLFAIKTATGFILLSLPAYLPQSVGWFTGWGGQWVANTLIMWITPMSGMFNFTIILGLLGTVSGGVLSIIVYEIARGNPYGIAILSFVVMVPFHYVFFTCPIYGFLAIMTQFAYLMVITTGYQNAVGGALTYDSIEVAAGKRMLFVALGIIGAALINWFPRPVTGRVELRKKISKTLLDLSLLYGAVYANILFQFDVSISQVKAFKVKMQSIQRQLKDEETYLRLSKLEPPLKGKFPFETYRELLERLNNMADLIEGMAYAANSMNKDWRQCLVDVFNQERFDYISCVLNIMRTLSGTLLLKIPLPPYMISPNDLKEKLDEKLSATIQTHPEQLHNETFPSYCAYSVASARFTEELNAAAECVEKLVGVENPEKWLLLHS